MNIRGIIKKSVIEPLSLSAINRIVKANAELAVMWNKSLSVFPDFKSHFTAPVDNLEVEHRIRLLVAAEALFVKKQVDELLTQSPQCTYADIGDSDGSVRTILQECFYKERLRSVGINLQQSAVQKMRSRGLEAICADALSLGGQGLSYDVVSVFETLEHISDPIGFLKSMAGAVKGKLVVSVPYIRNSRVNLAYLSPGWPKDKIPTVENTHIFELSPMDWSKIFVHTGWRITDEFKLFMYPMGSIHRLILQPYWRYRSFEGFWFICLVKDNRSCSSYCVE